MDLTEWGGPVTATLQVDGPPETDIDPPANTLQKLFKPSVKLDLPLSLQTM